MKTHNTQRLAGMCRRVTVWALLVSLLWTTVMPEVRAYTADGRAFLVNTEAFDTVDAGDGATNIELRFGDSTRTILYDVTLSAFVFSGNVYVRGTLSGNFLHASKTLSASGRLIVESGALIGTSGSTPVFAVDAGKSAVRVNASTPTVGKNFEVTGNSFFSVNEENDTFVIHNGPNGYDHMNVNGDIKYTLLETDRAASFGVAIGKTTAPKSDLDVVGTISGSFLAISQTASGRNLFALSSITGSHLYASSTFAGAGLSSCSNATTSKLLWNSATKTFSCGTDTDTNTQFSGTGALQTYFDNRFVNTAGDHMTGALTIRPTTGSGLHVIQPNNATGVTITTSATTNAGLNIEANSLTTGTAFRVYSNAGNFSDRHLVEIVNDNNGAQGTTALYIQQDARNPAFHVVSNTNIGDALVFEGLSLTAGNALEISVDSTMTTGRAMRVFGGPNANYDVFSVDEEGRTSIGSGSVAATTPYMLRVNGFMTGSIIHAEQDLTSSGTLRVYGSTGIGAAGFVPEATLDVLGTISGTTLTVSRNGSFSGSLNVVRGLSGSVIEATTISGTNLFATRSITGSHINAALTFAGAGLTDCDGTTQKILWNDATKTFSCGTDQNAGAWSGTGSLQTYFDNRYVNTAGDTMTGTLIFNPVGTTMAINARGIISGSSLAISNNASFSGTVFLRSNFGLRWQGGSQLYEQSGTARMLYQPNGDRFEILDEVGSNFIAGFHGGASSLTNSIRLYNAVGIGNVAGYAQNGTLPSNGLLVSGFTGLGLTGPEKQLDVLGTISGSILTISGNGSFSGSLNVVRGLSGSVIEATTISGTNLFATRSITGSHINAALTFAGAGLTNCTGSSNKITWSSATKQFGCETDQTGGGGSNWSNTGSLQGYFDNRYVNTSGDTMTGTLIFNPVGTNLTINARGIISGSILNISGPVNLSGTSLTALANTVRFQNRTDSTTGYQVFDADGGTSVFNIDTQNERVGIGTDSPSTPLHVVNNGNTQAYMRFTNTTNGANAIAGLQIEGQSSDWGIYSHAAARSITRYGVTVGGWSELIASNLVSSTNGILIGTGTQDKPIVFGNNDVERMRIAAGGKIGVGTTSPRTELDVVGTISGSYLQIAQTASGRNIFALQSITGTDLYAASRFAGAGLSDCDNATTSKLLWDAATKTFSCGTDQTGGSSGGLDYATASGIFVKRSGGTMTGSLTVNMSTGAFVTASGANVGTNVLAIANEGGFAYVGLTSNASTDLRIFDVRNPSIPTLVGGIELALSAQKVVVNGRYLYVGFSSSPGNDFGIYDISRPAAPVLLGGIELGGAVTSLSIDGRYAYIMVGSTLYIADISDPLLPKVVGSFVGSFQGTTHVVHDRILYTTHGANYDPLTINVSNPNVPKAIYSSLAATFAKGNDIVLSGKYGFIVGEDTDLVNGSLLSFNLGNPASPANIAQLTLTTPANTIDVIGKYAFIGTDVNGSGPELLVYDISNPAAMRYVTSVEYGVNVNVVRADGNHLYVGLASATGIDFVMLNLAGINATAGAFGSLLATKLNVFSDSWFGNDVSVMGALSAGQGIRADGFSTFTSGSGGYSVRVVQQTSRTGALAITAHGGTTAPHITFGSGAAFDTNLFRSAANTLKTSGSFFALGRISGSSLVVDGTGSFSGSLRVVRGISGSVLEMTQTLSGRSLNISGTGAATSPLMFSSVGKGFIGFGTNTPISQLHVQGGDVSSFHIGGGSNAVSLPTSYAQASMVDGFRVESFRTGAGVKYNDIIAAEFGGFDPTNFRFFTVPSGDGSAQERMTITSTGRVGIGITNANGPETELDVLGTISGSYVQIAQTLSGRNIFALRSITGSHLYASSTFAGAGLSDCDNATTSKLLWNDATKTFSCGTDQTGGGSSSGGGGWADDGSVVRLETIGDQVGIGTTSVDSGVKTEVVGILSGSTVKASTSLASSGVIVLRAPNTVSPTLVADGATQKVGINTASPHSSFTASGTFATSVRIATSTGSINGGDQIIFASGSSMITLTLPSASGVPGRQYTIKKTSSSINNHARKVIINTTSSQTIDRLPQWVLTHRGQQLTVVSDGSNWQIVDGSRYGLNGYRVMGTTMNQWYGQMATATANTTAALTTTATIRVFPFIAEKVTTINGMAVSVQTTAASAEVRLGIFADNGASYPDALVVDAGTVATTSTGMRSICNSGCTSAGNSAFPVTIQPGLYWLAINNNSIAHTHRGYAMAQVIPVLGHPNNYTTTRVVGWNIANSYAAFPSTFPTGASASTAIPIPAITVRIQE